MGNPYSSASISNYNSSPPSDDGTQASQNEITWAKHKTKLADPIKALAETINTNVAAAFAKIFGGDTSAISANYTVVSADQGKLIAASNTITISLPAAATIAKPFCIAIHNSGTGTVTIDGDGTETIDGSTTLALAAGAWAILVTDGTAWRTLGSFATKLSDIPNKATPVVADSVVLMDSAASSVAKTSTITELAATLVAAVAAAQSDQETGTSTTLFVAPGTQRYHPGHPKAWAYADTSGGLTAGYGVSAITDVATGKIGISFTTAFSSVSYRSQFGIRTAVATRTCMADNGGTQTAARSDGVCLDSSAGTATDPNNWYWEGSGDQ